MLGSSTEDGATLTLSLSECVSINDSVSVVASSYTDRASSDMYRPPDEPPVGLDMALAKEITVVDSAAVYQNAHSTVYRGTRDGKLVAVQAIRGFQLNPSINQELKRVQERWVSLDHKNIQKPLAFGNCAKLSIYPCIVSSWCGNGNVSDFTKNNVITRTQCLDLMQEVASGVAYLHSLNPPFIHGAIKPSNILVEGNGRAVVCDFRVHSTRRESPNTNDVRYIAPEMIRHTGSPESTTQTDVWSEACLLYEIAYSKPPHAHIETCWELLTEIGNGHPPAKRPSGLSKSATRFWKMVLEPAWNVNPNRRPTAASIGQYLAEHGNDIVPTLSR